VADQPTTVGEDVTEWLVQFVSRKEDGRETEEGRHSFTIESEARAMYDELLNADPPYVSHWWRIELRCRTITPWTVLASTGYAQQEADSG
jgi:hypothetical protein